MVLVAQVHGLVVVELAVVAVQLPALPPGVADKGGVGGAEVCDRKAKRVV